jgi:hypothetical protein
MNNERRFQVDSSVVYASSSVAEFGTGALRAFRAELLRMASREDGLAADEAGKVPYWKPTPESVIGRRLAAAVLRQEADRLLDMHLTRTVTG